MFPDLADWVSGTMDLSLRGTLGRVWTATGTVALGRGELAGVDVTNLRLLVYLSFDPGGRRVQAQVRWTSAQVALGRVDGKLELRWGLAKIVEEFGLAEGIGVGSGVMEQTGTVGARRGLGHAGKNSALLSRSSRVVLGATLLIDARSGSKPYEGQSVLPNPCGSG